MSSAPERVIALLDYMEALEKLKQKPESVVPSRPFTFAPPDLQRYFEIQTDLQSDNGQIWLRVPRLQAIPPPPLPATLTPWVDLSASPGTVPKLKTAAHTLEDGESVVRNLADNPDVQADFDAYRDWMWGPWSETELVRRQAIEFYQKVFSLLQELHEATVEAQQELVWGFGHISWCPTSSATISYPLLTVPCNLELDTRTSAIGVTPRSKGIRLELAPFMSEDLASECRAIEKFWDEAKDNIELNPFDRGSLSPLLQFAAAKLSKNGVMKAMEPFASVPRPESNLLVTDNWILFVRKRPTDILVRDIENLKKAVEKAPELPSVIESLVTAASDVVETLPSVSFRGLATREEGESPRELYFPMPYNDEQLTIAKQLEVSDGVVVQGPPGTGKTYTIANIICHYLAQGKRVLVTSKGESALSVLQEKLPDRIRPLSVALMSESGDGMKEFEHSIQSIADGLSSGTDHELLSEIRQCQDSLEHRHAEIARIDQAVARLAAEHLRRHTVDGEVMVAGDLAKLVMNGHALHHWFDDALPEEGDSDPAIEDAAVQGLRSARIRLGEHLALLDEHAPTPNQLPALPQLVGWHRNLQSAADIEQQVQSGQLLPLRDPRPELLSEVDQVNRFLDQRQALVNELDAMGAVWVANFAKHLRKLPDQDPVLASLYALCERAVALESERRELLPLAVIAPADIELQPGVVAAIARGAAGNRPFLLPLGQAADRGVVDSIVVAGQKPGDASGWQSVQRVLDWRRAVRALTPSFTPVAVELGVPALPEGLEDSLRALQSIAKTVQLARRLIRVFDEKIESRLAVVFSTEVVRGILSEGRLIQAARSLQSHLDRAQLVRTHAEVQATVAGLQPYQGDLVARLRRLLTESLGALEVTEAMVRAVWSGLVKECQTLHDHQADLETVRHVTDQLAKLGAARWAGQLRSQPAAGHDDPLLPATWRQAWRWQHYRLLLARIDGHRAFQDRFKKREDASQDLARAYQQLVACKTWLSLRQNTPPSVKQALTQYQLAISSMPKGLTAKSRPRYLRQAREAMDRAYPAVPCWIMPHWRVSEAIPAELGMFDLVIIDEASQSDIEAMPSILRGKKVLVVGDDEQVSPSNVGVLNSQINSLYDRYLRDQPHGASLSQEKSIYDLARTVFAGQTVMLKEHFRCVPAIIEYSKREYYNNQINPLRLPLAHERLDPPLIDVYVKGGNRRGDTNKPEALAIVQEIEAIIAEPVYKGRSIGVVTLHGNEQAKMIQELITQRIDPAEIVQRHITAGAPPIFQGRERDIMMISMVNDGSMPGPNSSKGQRQRFNVALSRARDRMYLFRSFMPEQINATSLTGGVLAHFKQPFQTNPHQDRSMRARCESDFEREVFDVLVNRGYRVSTQVHAGVYRIDLVVEDDAGRRLAVECDGDRYHGPDRWAYDMSRQRVLERAGWRFWRCFASSFVRRREEVIEDLINTLTNLRIAPVGHRDFDTCEWVDYREVDPLNLDADSDESPTDAQESAA